MPDTPPELLVLAGEASGDRLAAAALREIGDRARAFGVGGGACARAGMRVVAATSSLSSMGALDVLRAAPAIARAWTAIAREVDRRPPRAAILANFTELSARLGPRLRARGVKVLWCAAPQVWAWRPSRARSLAHAMDRLAVLLPFEVPLWRAAGVDATYVGHPAVALARTPCAEARRALGIDAGSRALAVLAGSRPGEVARLASTLTEAAAAARARGLVDDVRVLAAPDLPVRARAQLDHAARAHDLRVDDVDPDAGAATLLSAFDASLVASGTASLEAALAGASPVVAYRMDPLAYAVARRLVTTPFIALPNVVLGRAAVPELVQADATPTRLVAALEVVLARASGPAIAAELRAALEPPDLGVATFGARVAALLDGWLSA